MDKQNYELIVKGFYDFLEEGKVMGRKCTRCGEVGFPPFIACNECGCPKTEWAEISGEATVTGLTMPGIMQNFPDVAEAFGPYCFASVKLKEGSEINAIVLGVTASDRDGLRQRLPVPVKPRIVQRDGYKTVFWELAE